jgi:hypothetical protein
MVGQRQGSKFKLDFTLYLMHVTCDPTDKILASNYTKLPWLSLLSGPRLPTTILYIWILSFPVGDWIQEDFLEVVAIRKGWAQVQMANAKIAKGSRMDSAAKELEPHRSQLEIKGCCYAPLFTLQTRLIHLDS